jgi:oligopeptide/dipeptide ABC transporter, ATP-binding protein, C-terminal domain
MADNKVLLSVKDLVVKFRVRGRILTAIRGISLDIYENESIAIVGESGSGKSVFTKTFAGMLDSNGFIDNGSLVFNDDELNDTYVPLTDDFKKSIEEYHVKLNEDSRLENGGETYRKIQKLESARKAHFNLSEEQERDFEKRMQDLKFERTELFNLKQTFDPKNEQDKIKETARQIAEMDDKIKALEAEKKKAVSQQKRKAAKDDDFNQKYKTRKAELEAKYTQETAKEITPEQDQRNLMIAKEIVLSTARMSPATRRRQAGKLLRALKEAMKLGVNLNDDSERSAVFENVTFLVRYIDETPEKLHGMGMLNLAKLKASKDWMHIRGGRIATVFQDPMTSLNPIITIGKQITSIIMKHQSVSELEARERAMKLMKKVGIPNAENRFDDYPFQYSGGMRQRIVIAIALSCQPKILICDEPTTALDVTIQAQILKLLKDLQKEFNYTIVFITHDLGVVANIADRVAVLYAGQIVELGKVEEVFYDPRHPYTWALLSSLPQLAQRNTELYSITGTPPSLYNKIVGDPFAPRNPYCMKIDTLKEPPMFQVSETHFAKTWLLDPRSPQIEKPEAIQGIHEKLMKAFNI